MTASYLPAVRYGGTIVSVHGLCQALAARGHEVHVLTTNVDGDTDSTVPLATPVGIDGVQVWYFSSPFLRRLYWSPTMARSLASHVGEFDVVHVHALFVWPVWAAARAARRAGVPYVAAPRGMLEKSLVNRKSRMMKTVLMAAVVRRMLEAAAAIHVTSGREAAEASAFGFDLPPLHEVPNGVDLTPPAWALHELPPAVAAVMSGPPFLLFLGRISWKKGLDRLIAALALVPDRTLVIAGPDEEGYRVALERQAEDCGVRQRLVFCGPVDGRAKAALLSRAQLLVLPSYSENFGNVVLEAMAAACPVVVTPEVGIASLVGESGAGVVSDGAPALLGAALARLAGDPPLRQAMGNRGRIAATQCSWAAVAERMEHVYREVC